MAPPALDIAALSGFLVWVAVLLMLGVRSYLHLIDGADHCFFGADIDSIIATVTLLSEEPAAVPTE
jgi:hypothetical protein